MDLGQGFGLGTAVFGFFGVLGFAFLFGVVAFDYFDYRKIATYDEKKIESLLQNSGIIRNKLKN